MYIKIKYIKQFLLILACVFFAGFNYLTFVRADNAVNSTAVDSDKDGLTDVEEKLYGTDINNYDSDGDGYSDGVEVKSGYDPTKPAPGDRIASSLINDGGVTEKTPNTSLMDDFSQELQTFIDSKGNQTVTNADVDDFVAEKIANKIGSRITLESLPIADPAQIKILKQEYSALNETERKAKMQGDAVAYYTKIMYILVSNAPQVMITNNDFEKFKDDFFERVATLASDKVDAAYFLDLADRIDLVLNQVEEIEVPETMLDLHIKSVRIIKGFLSLREEPDFTSDPIAKMTFLAKIEDLSTLATDFLEIDFTNYFSTLE